MVEILCVFNNVLSNCLIWSSRPTLLYVFNKTRNCISFSFHCCVSAPLLLPSNLRSGYLSVKGHRSCTYRLTDLVKPVAESRGYCRPRPNIYGRPCWCSRNTFASEIAAPVNGTPLPPCPLAPPLGKIYADRFVTIWRS